MRWKCGSTVIYTGTSALSAVHAPGRQTVGSTATIGMHLARLSLPNVQVGAFLTGWVAFSHLYVEDFFLKAEETRELFLIESLLTIQNIFFDV